MMNGERLAALFSPRDNARCFWTPPAAQNAALDGFRALSILFVVLFHCFYLPQPAFGDLSQFAAYVQSLPAWLGWVWHGDSGVDMFLILSGHLIASLLLRDRQKSGALRTGRFYAHRALRILPVYVLAVALAAPFQRNGGYFWANLLFINNLLPLEHILIPWSWSLSIEVQFYLLFPLVLTLLLRSRRPLACLAALFVAAILINYAVLLAHPELTRQPMVWLATKHPGTTLIYFEKLYVNLYTRMSPLILGVALAWALHHHGAALRGWLARHVVAAAAAAIAALAAVIWIVQVPTYDPAVVHSTAFNLHYLALSKPLFSAGMAVLLLLALTGRGLGVTFGRLLSYRFWYPLSQAAYSMYLFHVPFVYGAYFLILGGKVHLTTLAPWAPLAAFALAVPLSLAFSFIVYLAIERPFINLYRRRSEAAA